MEERKALETGKGNRIKRKRRIRQGVFIGREEEERNKVGEMEERRGTNKAKGYSRIRG